MAHHYDDSEYGSYGDEVPRAWLADCLARGVDGWSSNWDREVDAVAWINARVDRLRFCSPRATIHRAVELGLIKADNDAGRYVISLDRSPVGDGSTGDEFRLGNDGTWRLVTDDAKRNAQLAERASA